MEIVKDAFVNRNGAYYKSGGIILGTQRISTKHLMQYWQQSNLEICLAINEFTNSKFIPDAIYIGRIPTHLGHFIMEGLPRLCDSINMKIPIIGYITDGMLPAGIRSTPHKDIRWVMSSITSENFYEVDEKELYQVGTLYVPTLPLHLSMSCSEPWRMTDMITKIVNASRIKHKNVEVIEELYLKRDGEQSKNIKYVMSNPSSELSEQIATISYANKLYGNTGSNTHMSIFAKSNCLTEWTQREDFQQTDRNQLICDLVKTFNNF